jgi:hypothetical protein
MCLGVKHPSGSYDQIFITVRQLRVCKCGTLWRANGSSVYNYCWSSTAQSFLGPSPAGLLTIFYCHRLDTPLAWRARFTYLYSPGTEWPGYNPRHWVPFYSPPTNRNVTLEVFDPASTRDLRKTRFLQLKFSEILAETHADCSYFLIKMNMEVAEQVFMIIRPVAQETDGTGYRKLIDASRDF